MMPKPRPLKPTLGPHLASKCRAHGVVFVLSTHMPYTEFLLPLQLLCFPQGLALPVSQVCEVVEMSNIVTMMIFGPQRTQCRITKGT